MRRSSDAHGQWAELRATRTAVMDERLRNRDASRWHRKSMRIVIDRTAATGIVGDCNYVRLQSATRDWNVDVDGRAAAVTVRPGSVRSGKARRVGP
jgi:hypothetical protein